MGQRLRRRLELAFCNDTERILKVFEIVLLTLKPERNPFDLAMKVMIFSVVGVIEPKLDQESVLDPTSDDFRPEYTVQWQLS